ncbi:MAG: hypothetical protein CMG33_04355 [Candidatus Marinimicrobia bacterium]|nr:hypothetical protein [Candidatus Neomarinimicrobiota bacterium]
MNEEKQLLESKIQESIENPQNMGEMINADAVGTVDSPNENSRATNKDASSLSKSFVQGGAVSGKIKVIPITNMEGNKS